MTPMTEAQRSLYEERSAILEFDAGLSRSEAEREARRLVLGERTQGELDLDEKHVEKTQFYAESETRAG